MGERFDYTKYRTRSISVSRLDAIADIVLNAGTGKVASIIAAVKLVLVLAYLIARKHLLDNELMILKQQYERERNNDDRRELDDEPLDGE